ncbi:non-structural protein [Scaphoideus titanus reo-like virus 1]|nr:non-structural protein [Scaphoideus titanus reo-like virus 1]
MSGMKMQDGTAIRRINDAITAFIAYELGETEKSASTVLNTLRNIRVHVGLAWPTILKYCFTHAASHMGVVRMLLDLATTEKIGMFTILASVGEHDPFNDVGLIFNKACAVLHLSDKDFLIIPDAFSTEVINFFDSQARNARISIENGLHDIEDKYVYRTNAVGSLLLSYISATVELKSWTESLAANSIGSSSSAVVMSGKIQNLRTVINQRILNFVRKNLSATSIHHRSLATTYNSEWEFLSEVPSVLNTLNPNKLKIASETGEDTSSASEISVVTSLEKAIDSTHVFDDLFGSRGGDDESGVLSLTELT